MGAELSEQLRWSEAADRGALFTWKANTAGSDKNYVIAS